ncbi:hypothetical protein ABXN37_28765, partial [Piscinibacter sakaiensis]|uniref:hypothetical protein n=1 Tax=Piscinibacter sakaiensis TaxID=1547922 RepID=UPI001E38ADFD
ALHYFLSGVRRRHNVGIQRPPKAVRWNERLDGSLAIPAEENKHEIRLGEHGQAKRAKQKAQKHSRNSSDVARRRSTFPPVSNAPLDDLDGRSDQHDDA